MKTSEVLGAAKTVLLEKGWTQGRSVNTKGEVCADGALCVASGAHFGADMVWPTMWPNTLDLKVYEPANKALEAALASMGIADDRSYVYYNDTPSTTFNDIMDLFDEAILLAKQQEADAE